MVPVTSQANQRTGEPVSLTSPAIVSNGLALYRVGAGDPFLFMPYPHGLSAVGDGSPRTAGLLRRFADLGRLALTFDPPGAGQSTRPVKLNITEMLECADETLAAFGIYEPVDVAGHSQGGVAALAFALERPESVRRLLLLNTSSGGPAFMHARGAIWNRTHPDFWRFALRAMISVVIPRRGPEIWMINLIFRDSYVDQSYFTPEPVSWRDWLQPPRPRAGWGSKVAWKIDYRSRLTEVRVPTLITGGRFDPQMPPDCAEELVRGIDGAQLVMFEQSGHNPFVEESDAFWQTIERFLDAKDSEDDES